MLPMPCCILLWVVASVCYIIPPTKARKPELTKLRDMTESRLIYATAAPDPDAATPDRTAEWPPLEGATIGAFGNESWLDWPPWNMSESDWTEWELENGNVSLYWLACVICLPVVLTAAYVIYLHVVRARRYRKWEYETPGRCFAGLADPERRPCCRTWHRDACAGKLRDGRSMASDCVRLSEEDSSYPGDVSASSYQLRGSKTPRLPSFANGPECSVRYEQLHCEDDGFPSADTINGQSADA